MNCFYCKGVDTIEETPTRFCSYDTGTPFLVENVPASVCRLCGDESFKGETVDTLEKIRAGDFLPQSIRVFQVFHFEDLKRPQEEDQGLGGTRPSNRANRDFINDYLQQNWSTLFRGMSGWELETMRAPERRLASVFITTKIPEDSLRNSSGLATSYRIDKAKHLVA